MDKFECVEDRYPTTQPTIVHELKRPTFLNATIIQDIERRKNEMFAAIHTEGDEKVSFTRTIQNF